MTSRFSIPVFLYARRLSIGAILIASLLGAGLCGCERMAPRYGFHEKTPPMVYKRTPLHGERDFVYRWRAKAYCSFKIDPASGSDDQKRILARYGQPDYTRQFKAKSGGKTAEWLFIDQDILVQFAEGDLAYSGPVTDYEKLLIDRGFPNEVVRTEALRGPERLDVVYWNWWHTRSQVYSFANGYLVDMIE